MGMYNLVPKKKARALKQQDKKEEPGLEEARPAADGEPAVLPEALAARDPPAPVEPEPDGGPEYTELALEQLLSPPSSGDITPTGNGHLATSW